MPIRQYTDKDGVAWQVWNIWPLGGMAIPRSSHDRRDAAPAGADAERRSSRDRRQTQLTPGLEGGWLCFQSTSEERRLSPIPGDWTSCSEAELAAYCQRAQRIDEPVSMLARTLAQPDTPPPA